MKFLYFIGMLLAGILAAFIGNLLAFWAVSIVVQNKFSALFGESTRSATPTVEPS